MDTYRYHRHSMSDPGSTYRTCDEISNVRQKRDPIERVRKLLLAHGIASEKELKDIEKQVRKDVDDAIAKAKENHAGGEIKLKVKFLRENFREDELVDMMINIFAT
ncbi:pyruvate dehydrogenase E1 component subunit alpha, mitochondrial-like isoform X2 [Arachis ipaensis]|uniref:pyruvate dehydrogenase E1 component subunit alpha, mitochondrial-like isoform X2 n=1 Tax=Arachis ipaensis TaxID=130454 RepID=UPI000A2B8DD6|nr:pyruvate dehydrogenase E1 component subunit alpha, mitochondrial-like isoform X2 [Arachis ipaensis]